jgi:phospholipid-binding lipoprotein MlaA
MRRPTFLFSALVLSFAAFSNGTAESLSASYTLIDKGTAIPVKNSSSVSKKDRGQTLYLSSAVSREAPTPKPTPLIKKQAGASHTVQRDSVTVIKPSGKPISPAHGKAGVSDDPGDDYGTPKNCLSDPIKPVNRGFFWFNHQLYHYVFTPLNKTYKFVFPGPVRTGISNAINNVEYPVRFVNDLLQWKPERAGLETEKFLLNTTAGVGGLIKVSNKFQTLAEVKPTDTSATFAKWGIPPGCYIVWPVIGPKSVRDTFGFAGDLALNPASWFTYGVIGGLTGTTALAVSAPQTVGNTSDKLDTYETVTHTSIDRYNAVKSAYEQNRIKVETQ